MAVPTVTGQVLIDMTNDLLAGYQNGVDSRALLTFLNMAKDEIWGVTKELHEEYFQVLSQSTVPTGEYYFAPLNTTTREYALPADLRSIEFVECITVGYEETKFTYRKLNSPDFQQARMSANVQTTPNNGTNVYFFSIAGKNQFVMANYPPTALVLILFYTRAIPDFEAGDTVDEILFPFSKKLAEFAAERAMIGVQDSAQFSAWKAVWRESLTDLVEAEGERNDADPTFVYDFTGSED